jgi:hypothetical protein
MSYFLRRDCRSSFGIASAHQSKTASHETNGPITQIVGFPGPFGDVIGAKQALGDRAIAVAFDAAIECAHS